MFDKILRYTDILFAGPKEWPRWLRRAFVLTMPFSLLLWIAALVVTSLLLVPCVIAAWIIIWASDLWE